MFKQQDPLKHPVIVHIDTIYKTAHILLLLAIAYNSSYLYAIFQEPEQANQNNQEITVNVNNNGQVSALPSDRSGNQRVKKKQGVNEVTGQTSTDTPKKPERMQKTTKPAEAEKANTNPITHKVEMLNNSADGAMVFKPGYIHINTGDSIEFQPVSYGHNVQTPEEVIGSKDAIPAGAEAFKGAMNEKLIVKFTKPGVYLYICNYHYIVGHVGVIQVGNDSHNIDQVRKAGEILKGKIFSHPERVDQYLKMVKIF